MTSSMPNNSKQLIEQLNSLNDIGIALSKEKNLDLLLEEILVAAKRLVNADGGTLYSVEQNQIRFQILHNDSLNIKMGGSSGISIPFPPIQLYDETGQPRTNLVVAYAVLNNETVNIAHVYHAEGFDFSGTKNFDAKTGYHSQSFLTVPIRDHEKQIIGVLQLLNATDPQTKEIMAFSETDQHLVESLASQAGVAWSNRLLMKQQEELFEAFINMINMSIDEKSPYTGAHCQRVPILTLMIADAAAKVQEGPLAPFKMTQEQRYELKIAGMLHDCGKVTTPVHVIDKSTKLETIFDRIALVDARFEILRRDAKIDFLEGKLTQAEYETLCQKLDQDQAFVQKANTGQEFMPPAAQDEIKRIAGYTYFDATQQQTVGFLSADEIENLCISRGTLNAAEREIINQHIIVTINMLESLPWPKHLQNVPDFAGAHHERADGKGYPKGLTKDQMTVQARSMAIADIFEALTAIDRPYKPGKTLTETLTILGRMALEGHIDIDLFRIFVKEKVYLEYAQQYLKPYQIDEVDVNKIPGFHASSV